MTDVGGFYSFTPGFQLLVAAGHSVALRPETYTYLALYWTWGHDADREAGAGGPIRLSQ